MSIDLTKANFQVFKNFDADIIDYKETYQEFFRQFTPYEYFVQSKYIRQVVFGNLNPGRQQTYEYFLTNKILKHIKEIFPKEKIRMFSADEIVIELDEVLNTELFYDIAKHENLVIDIEIFKLKTMLGKYTIKEFLNKDGFEIMCVPMDLKPQVLKKYLNLPLDDRDLLFYKDGKDGGFLCKYQTLIFPENKKRP